jgi:hypothetical protein
MAYVPAHQLLPPLLQAVAQTRSMLRKKPATPLPAHVLVEMRLADDCYQALTSLVKKLIFN